MSLILVGMSHHSAPIDARERLTCPDYRLSDALAALASCPAVRECALLSTCNRMEIYASVTSVTPETGYETLISHLAAYHNLPREQFASFLYLKSEQEAVLHLMRVAGGLDSQILGEAQILGQVRSALQAAQQAGTAGSALHALFQQAITGSRRIQNETGLMRGAFSVGRAAVDMAGHIFSDLSRASVLILGAGKMSELTARHLVANGVKFIVVANRTYDRAVTLAASLGGSAIRYDDFQDALITADIVIASTAAPHAIVRRETLQPILRKRRGRPLFLIDLSVPRNVAPDVADLENVFVRNIDELQDVVSDEAQTRSVEATQGEAIAREETEKFLQWYRAREAAPTIAQLKGHIEQIRQDDMAILRGKLPHLSERDWQAIELSTHAMMNHVTREPILRLKQEVNAAAEAETAPRYDLATAAREMFALDSLAAPETAAVEAEPKITPLRTADNAVEILAEEKR